MPEDADAFAVPVCSDRLNDFGRELDWTFLARQGFEGKVGETQWIAAHDGGPTMLVVGAGPKAKVDAAVLRDVAAATARAARRLSWLGGALLDVAPSRMDKAGAAQAVAEGFALAAYSYDRFKTDPEPSHLERFTLVAGGPRRARAGLDRGARIAEAVALARDLVNAPAGALTPRDLAQVAIEVAEREGLGVSVLDEVDIESAGLGGLLGVNQGSDEPPRFIELTYAPADPVGSVALVGKGITFDSGGLSLKTADGMMTMKTDMSGAAAVVATLSVLSALGVAVEVSAYVPATENMPGGRAIKPGDVLRIRNGTTVEVLNTDAEGRLVLADALSLAVEAKPHAIVDLATLTGACVVALGKQVAGVMGNHDGWIAQVEAAAARADEPVWRLPLPAEYRSQLDSEVADLKNIGAPGQAGALTAGLFLQAFVGDVPWVHLDIAGPARAEADDGWISRGGTGFGVRTLVELLCSFERPQPAKVAG
ncbi:MAG: leucyl aminopeptidase [Acidimicrobiales bacterium]|nr:leucyl aminopeptidase [Acidimicrobiales bacterium]